MGRGEEAAASWSHWQRAVAHVSIVIVFLLTALGYAPVRDRTAAAARSEDAGPPSNPFVTTAQIATARGDALVGDQRAAKEDVDAIGHDLQHFARMPDPAHPIDHEAARAVVRRLSGVRAAIWLDETRLAVMVDGPAQRSIATIDRVCQALAPQGDTLAVVVQLEDQTAKAADAATSLSRHCVLPVGELAFLQKKREVEIVSPGLRTAFEAQLAR